MDKFYIFGIVIAVIIVLCSVGIVLYILDLKHHMAKWEDFRERQINNVSTLTKSLINASERQRDIFSAMSNQFDSIAESYEYITEQYKELRKAYDAMRDKYEELLYSYHEVEEGYSAAYEAFLKYNEVFKKLTQESDEKEVLVVTGMSQ